MHDSIASKFHVAQDHANHGRNPEFLQSCEALYTQHLTDPAAIVRLGALYLAYGFPSNAKKCFNELLKQLPNDVDVQLNLAHAELLLGCVNECQRIFRKLLEDNPSDLRVLQHAIFFSEYFQNTTAKERFLLAKKWGELAILKANGPHSRPPKPNYKNRQIRIGYISGDFCQHTVGFLIKNVIARHDRNRFKIHTFSSGYVDDWVTNEIRTHSDFFDVRALNDQALVSLIKRCEIDILVDLSGHTGGSRLSAFAYRPAPIQLSWLGYYATTGLEYIDGILLDHWHTSPEGKSNFIEPIIQMPYGRWCYLPAFPAPAPSPPPALKNGYITFGNFNNTLKFNSKVFKLWSEILKSVPNSRLLLKWRTFNDPEYRSFVQNQFVINGINLARIELRGPSFHMKMLEEYQDIDISLDPFPFSGGMTSCEALYMGVPVITMPCDQTVSRQTTAFLHLINRSNWVATNPESYLLIARDLAIDDQRLIFERNNLREAMLQSPLMHIKLFNDSLEKIFIDCVQQL